MKHFHFQICFLLACSFYNCTFAQPTVVCGDSGHQISICTNKTTFLVFPAPIVEGDHGSGDVLVKQLKKARNIIKLKAVKENCNPTNVSVTTEDGNIFSINVAYDPNPIKLIYLIDKNESCPINLSGKQSDELGENDIVAISKKIAELYNSNTRHVTSKYDLDLALTGIYICKHTLFFKVNISNGSNIPFDADFIRYYQKDKSHNKKVSHTEKEMHPVQVMQLDSGSVMPNASVNMVIAFDKFTIADDKYFVIEAYEKNGDRNLMLRIKGKTILKASNVATD